MGSDGVIMGLCGILMGLYLDYAEIEITFNGIQREDT